jgi:hypothetical protein
LWSKKDVHVNTDATLELVDPLTIGKPNLYRLSIRLKIDYIKIGAQESGWYISDREAAKAFFGRKQKLYYIKTNGHWDIPEKDKNKKPLRRLHKQEQPDWFTRIGEYLIGFHPMIGPLYSTWQFLNHFKGGKLAPT